MRWPGSDYRQALRSILGGGDRCGTRLRSGQTPQRSEGPRDVVAVNLFSPFDPEAIPRDHLVGPTSAGRVGRSDIDEVQGAARAVASMENRRGGGAIADTAADYLRTFAPLLRGIPMGSRPEVYDVQPVLPSAQSEFECGPTDFDREREVDAHTVGVGTSPFSGDQIVRRMQRSHTGR